MNCLYRSVQIWFQNTRNRKKRLANYLNNSNQTTSIAVDYSIEYNQTGTTSTASIDEYSNYSQTTTTPRTVMKLKNYNKTTPATTTMEVPNKDNQTVIQPFENQPTMTASEKTTTVSEPDLLIGTTTRTPTKSKITTTAGNQETCKVDSEQKNTRPTIIKSMAAARSNSQKDEMQDVKEDKKEKVSEKRPISQH